MMTFAPQPVSLQQMPILQGPIQQPPGDLPLPPESPPEPVTDPIVPPPPIEDPDIIQPGQPPEPMIASSPRLAIVRNLGQTAAF